MEMEYVRIKLPTNSDKIVTTYGIDYGGPVKLLHRIGNNIILHKPSYTVWKSRGQQGTDPAKLMVGTLFLDAAGNVWVSLFHEIETGRYWHDARKAASISAQIGIGKLPAWGKEFDRD